MSSKIDHQYVTASQPTQISGPSLPALLVKLVHAPHVYAGIAREGHVPSVFRVLPLVEVMCIKDSAAVG